MPNYAALARELGIDGIIHGDELRSRCPLHDDTHPSFSLNVESGLWICHSRCGKGNFVHLIERVNNCTFGEAYEWLITNGRSNSTERVYDQLSSILAPPERPAIAPTSLAWKVQYESLDNNYMPTWFLERGFTWATVNHWGIRYNPGQASIVVPAYWRGQLVGTITRHTDPKFPKYQNSDNFPKEKILYGEILANQAYIILTEGALDPIWLWQNGYNGIGLLGLYLSNNQIDLLRALRYGEIILGLDNDFEGRKATNEVITRLVSAGWMLPQLSILQYPNGKKDANDCSDVELDTAFRERKNLFQWSR